MDTGSGVVHRASNNVRIATANGHSVYRTLKTPDPFVSVERVSAESFIRHAEWFDTLASTSDRAIHLAAWPDLPTPALVVARANGRARPRPQHVVGRRRSTYVQPAPGHFQPRHHAPRLAAVVVDHRRSRLRRLADRSSSIDRRHQVAERCAARRRQSVRHPNRVTGRPRPGQKPLDRRRRRQRKQLVACRAHAAGPTGTALCDATDRRHDLPRVLLAVLHALENRLQQLASGDSQLPQTWQRLDLLVEENVVVENNGKRIAGKSVGIAIDGALVIETNLGPQTIYSGAVHAY